MDDFLDLWRTLSAIVRIPIAMLTILAAAYLWGVVLMPRTAAAILVVGFVMLFVSPSDAHRRGYHD